MEQSDWNDAEVALFESEQRYRALVENLLNGVVQLRVVLENDQPSDFVFVQTNAAFDGQLRLGDVIGKRISEVVPSFRTADPALFATYARVARTGVPERFDTYSVAVQRWFALSVYRASHDHIVVVLDDVTPRKHTEQALLAANAELEHRVRERTADLESFTYSISHDLRGPLRAINGYAQLTLDDYGGQLPEDGQDMLRSIHQASVRMSVLIEDLLRLSKLGRQALQRRTIDTAGLVRGVLDELMREPRDHPVELRIGELPPCNADGSLLRQVWLNLASNALKYSRQRSPATIEIGHTVDGAYFIRDNGVGFDMRSADRLFGVFQRMHSASEFEGEGIGLAIVERIVSRHGGRVWADSEIGRGSTFFFTLDDNRNATLGQAGRRESAESAESSDPADPADPAAAGTSSPPLQPRP